VQAVPSAHDSSLGRLGLRSSNGCPVDGPLVRVRGKWWRRLLLRGRRPRLGVVVLTILAAVATGYLVDIWSIPLLVICVVVLIPLGENPQDSDGWPYWALQLSGLTIFLVPAALLGMAARFIVDVTVLVRERRRATPSA
jgi:hypothetical protein